MKKRGPKLSPAHNGNGTRAEFCLRIKNLRTLLGLDHAAFGRQIGVTMFEVYRWERVQGKVYPGKENWEKILRLEKMNFGANENQKEM